MFDHLVGLALKGLNNYLTLFRPTFTFETCYAGKQFMHDMKQNQKYTFKGKLENFIRKIEFQNFTHASIYQNNKDVMTDHKTSLLMFITSHYLILQLLAHTTAKLDAFTTGLWAIF